MEGIVENSKAYLDFKEQINAVGVNRKDGYYPKLLDEIYDWERNEIEKLIWSQFCDKDDLGMAIFLPKLKKYPGIQKLEEKLSVSPIPSNQSSVISIILFGIKEDDKYLEVIKENIRLEPNKIQNIQNVAMLVYCKPSKKIYDVLVDVYINSEDEVMRSTAVTGILYNKGYIKDPLSIKEMNDNVELRKKFRLDDVVERKKIIERFN